ncbi:hypothetical protein [Microvirga mediterraneensis]|uniref:Uncharacterized protein n=1 Tax=Microvirga mediterraneensis TaxID=2754695 RepID=A0A838BMY1_9HYPH|nr:hypothetical protein [Microvirga mediterraneensis]MBA1157044.1 hypothetical protein [Microvirga mediterraneensis]
MTQGKNGDDNALAELASAAEVLASVLEVEKNEILKQLTELVNRRAALERVKKRPSLRLVLDL